MTTEHHRHITALLTALLADDAQGVMTHLRAGMETLGLVALVVELGTLTNSLGVELHGPNWSNVVAGAQFELAHDLAEIERRALDAEQEDGQGEGGSEC